MAGFDAVFVGSGVNSLAGAALLAKDGWRVCVLERNDWLGGAIKTVEGLTAPGFTHEVFSSWHPLWVGSPAYAELKPDLDRLGLEYLNTDLPTATAFPDGSSAHLSTDGAANVAALGEAWQRQFDQFMAGADIAFGALGTELWSGQGLSLGRKAYRQLGRRGLVEFAGHSLLSARDWLTDTFDRERGARPARPLGAPHGARPRPGGVRLHDAGDRLRAPARRDAGPARRWREARRGPRSDRAPGGRRAAHRSRRRADRRLGRSRDRGPAGRRRDDRGLAGGSRLRDPDPAVRAAARRGRCAVTRPRRRGPVPLRARRDADPYRHERAAPVAWRRASRPHPAARTSPPVSTACRGRSTRPTAACSRPRRRSRSASRWQSTPRARRTARG